MGVSNGGFCSAERAAADDADDDAICDDALALFYYWVTFGPLSRGSAACGCALIAM